MAETLTPAQRMAVEDRGGKLLVSAAAGSGKTKVLVDRLLSYLTDPVNPASLDDFLIITYTKAAAAELRGKISDKLTAFIAEHPENRHMQQQIQRLYLAKISTVHSFCADILREYAYKLDISADFRIAEENECQEMMHQVLEQLLDDAYVHYLDDPSFCAFVDTQGLGRDDRQVPEIILQIYSSALCHLDPEAWLDWCVNSAKVNDLTDAGQTIWGQYILDDLKTYVTKQIASLEGCIDKCTAVEGLEKPASLLSATVCDLLSLSQCVTWDDVVNHKSIEYGTLTFKKEHKDTILAQQIKTIRKHCKEGLSKKLRVFTDNSQMVLEQLNEASLACEGLVKLVKEFRSRYEKVKKLRRVLDFSDIEQKTLDLLLGKKRTSITAANVDIADRFREIMIDEYQDSNEVQDAIFSALTDVRKNCFMVGDVKQSIYQFRLADPGIFLKKYHDYLPAERAETGQGRKILLSNNFRSSAGVISAVNDVFKTCMSEAVGGLQYGADEMLYEGIPHISLPDPEVELYGIDIKEDTYREEAKFVAQQIKELLNGKRMVRNGDILRPINADDIVILLRSPGSVGGEFCFALEELGIPCTMGNDLDLLQEPQVDTLRSILQIIHNPLQDIPLIAALSSPVFGFTADDLAKVRCNSRKTDFYNAVKTDDAQCSKNFIAILNQLRKEARFLSVTQLIHRIFLRTNMLSVYGAMENGLENVRNLQHFCQIAADFESTGRKELSYFLEYLEAMQQRGLPVSGGSAAGSVRIMSIHKSKGLEFPVVFLCGLSRNFNMTDLQKTVLCHKEMGLGLTCVNAKQRIRFPSLAKRAIAAKIMSESISEEMRVLYVAMTRARDRLIMTYAVPKLADKIQDAVLRLELTDKELLTGNVSCPGSWILQSALSRTEAGEFFNLGGYPEQTRVLDHPWKIRIAQAGEASSEAQDSTYAVETLSQEVLEKMRRGLAFCYANKPATTMPSKLTATQMKGRFKDVEAAEFSASANQTNRSFRKAGPGKAMLSGTDYGNALHMFMQYSDFLACNDLSGIAAQLDKLVAQGIMTEEQVQLVDKEAIVRFFATDLGQKIKTSREVLREFKFSILEEASSYVADVQDDQVLLQGVIDCAVIEADGITIVDFKTDAVTADTVLQRAETYYPQISMYVKALSRIYQLPIKQAFLYFFRCGELISVK